MNFETPETSERAAATERAKRVERARCARHPSTFWSNEMTLTTLCTLTLWAAPMGGAATPPSSVEEIEWNHGALESVQAEAARTKKDILVYLWSESNAACSAYYQNQLQDQRVVEATRPFLCLSAQLESEHGRELFERYAIQVMPTLLVLDGSDASAQDAIFGAANIPSIVHHLERIARDEGTLRDLVRRTIESPDDLELRGRLAAHHDSLGQNAKARELRDSIRADDPEGQSAVAASMYLQDKARELLMPAPVLTPSLVEELSAYVESIVPATTRQSGWDKVAELQNAIGNWDAEFAAWRKAFPDVPDRQLYNWGWNRGLWWWSNRDHLSKSEKDFALEVARKTVAVSERLSAEDPGYYDPGLFLTRRLNMLAMVLYMQGEKKEASALMKRCVELYPASDEYRARHQAYTDGGPDGYFNTYSDYDASWSPNGKKLVFTSTRDRNAEIYIADVKRGTVKRVTRSLASDEQGAFAPKGKDVVFRSDRFKLHAIYRAKATGKNVQLLVPLEGDGEMPAASGMPSYSKDGKSLAFIRVVEGIPQAMLADAAGENAVRVVGHPSGADSIAWVGRRLAYSATRDGEKDIFTVAADGSDEMNLTPADDGSWNVEPTGSRDGRSVVFASWRDGQCHIWSVGTDGTALTQLTDVKAQDRRPRFSPNGKQIVFDRSVDGAGSRLWIMNADGSRARPVLKGD